MIETASTITSKTTTTNLNNSSVSGTTTTPSVKSNNKMIGTAHEPKIVRKILPFAIFLITFATVMSILMVYMDTTAMRHHQFQINMTQDYDVRVAQDNEQLIQFIREFLIRPAIDIEHSKSLPVADCQPTDLEKFVAHLLNNKKHGTFIEAGAYRQNRISDTEWLERNLSWSGLLVQTYPKDLFVLLKRGRSKSKYIHACLSTQPHPKEITIPQDSQLDGVKINSVVQANSVFSSDDNDSFSTRIKCFPLFSLILAMNTTELDFLKLETDCNELQILETIPFERVHIKIISLHYSNCHSFVGNTDTDRITINRIKRTLTSHKYSFVRNYQDHYLFIYKN